jgi:hypothetical protein
MAANEVTLMEAKHRCARLDDTGRFSLIELSADYHGSRAKHLDGIASARRSIG